jgi:plastocyanin
MTRPAAVLFVCAALATVLPVAGCGSDGGGGDSSTTAAESSSTSTTAAGGGSSSGSSGAATQTDKVEIADYKFDPDPIEVDAGTKVTWTNDDDAPHTATADDGSFDTDTLDKGQSGSVTLDQPGTYTYFCRFHAFMKGTVEVK